VQREGCTFDDLVFQVLQYRRWFQFKAADTIQLYKEVLDSSHHLCNNIEPGINSSSGGATQRRSRSNDLTEKILAGRTLS